MRFIAINMMHTLIRRWRKSNQSLKAFIQKKEKKYATFDVCAAHGESKQKQHTCKHSLIEPEECAKFVARLCGLSVVRHQDNQNRFYVNDSWSLKNKIVVHVHSQPLVLTN